MPLLGTGMKKKQSVSIWSSLGNRGACRAFLMMFFASGLLPFLPYFLAFAAGAMIYVVVEELIPEASHGSHSNLGTLGFAAGFVIMMILDVALG